MTSLSAAPDPLDPGGSASAAANHEKVISNMRKLFCVTSLVIFDAAVVIFVILGYQGIMNLNEILIGIGIMIVGCLFLGGAIALIYYAWKTWDQPPVERKLRV